MSPAAKIGVFVVFAVAYIVFFVVSIKLQSHTKRWVLNGRYFLSGEVALLLSVTAVFLFIWLLSGYFSLKLIVTFIAVSQLGIIVTWILKQVLGTGSPEANARFLWANAETGIRYPGFWISGVILLLLGMIAYPIGVGVEYFRYERPSQELTRIVFQWTFVVFGIYGYVLMLPLFVSLVMRRDVDDGSRSTTFLSQTAGLFTTALMLSILFWSFGFSAQGRIIGFADLGLVVSLELVVTLIVFFVLGALMPFSIGTLRARKWRISLLEKRGSWLSKAIDLLGVPRVDDYAPELAKLHDEVDSEGTAFSEGDRTLEVGKILSAGKDVPAVMAELVPIFPSVRNTDPRFQYLDWLAEFQGTIKKIADALAKESSGGAKIGIAKGWAEGLRSRRDDFGKEIDELKHNKHPVWAAVSLLLVPACSLIVGKFGEWVWGIFLTTSALGE